MIIGHLRDAKRDSITVEGTDRASIQWLLGPDDGMRHFYMRYVTVEPGGIIPLHSHEVMHEMFIVRGSGAVILEDGESPIEEGSFVFMPGAKIHGTRNTGEGPLEFICCINAL